MISFLSGLGLAGLALVYVLLVKRSSLEPQLAAALLGVRIILAIAVVGGTWYHINDQKENGRNFWGKLKIDRSLFIGKWKGSFTGRSNTGEKQFNRYSFYEDGTFYDQDKAVFGEWLYIPDENMLKLSYANDVEMHFFDSFKWGTTLIKSNRFEGSFDKISGNPGEKPKLEE